MHKNKNNTMKIKKNILNNGISLNKKKLAAKNQNSILWKNAPRRQGPSVFNLTFLLLGMKNIMTKSPSSYCPQVARVVHR